MNQIPTDPASVYTKDYYDHYGSETGVPYDRDEPVWQNHFGTLARTLVERYHPRTTLDVGCAKGFLVERLRDEGVEAFGVDVSPYAISQVREDIRQYCHVANGTEPLSGRFDLITCIEVAEHMPEADACKAIAEMCQHTDQVIFSSTDSGFDEPTHINIHPAEYWIELFQQHGFFPDRGFQPEFITPQALRFLRCNRQIIRVAVFSHEPPNCAVALLRLAGSIRHLEQRNLMELQWCTVGKPQINLQKSLDSDIFVVHREFCDRRISPPVIAAARALGKPVVFEMDDLLINVPTTNPNHRYCAEITPDILAMLREADFVTVTTEPLRRFLEEAEGQSKKKIHVLPNFISLDIWGGAKPPPEVPEEPFVIGWFGTATHDEDLAIIKPAIVQLAAKYPGKLVFKFWGYLPDDLKDISGVQLVRGSQPDLRLHARDVVNCRIDLALAPLLDHPFNHAKSDLKWLEYSICYIPAIFSAISPYTGSVEHGRTGWVVENRPELWFEAIERLMHDHELRRSIAIQAHDEVFQRRTVNVGADRWDALYRSFHVSGPKPEKLKVNSTATLRDYAAAFLTQHAANAVARNGDFAGAIKIFEETVAQCMPPGTVQGSLVNNLLQQYRHTIVKLKESVEVTASLRIAGKVADAGESRAAIRIYLDILGAALKENNPSKVLQIAVEVARAFKTLEPEQGLRVLGMGVQLARSIRSDSAVRALELLRAEYPQKSPAPRPVQSGKGLASSSAASTPKSSRISSCPVVSIIIPVFNNLALTRACLDSLAQVPADVDHEIILIDNASSDGTAEYLLNEETNGLIRRITNRANKGFAHACNQGAQASSGSLLIFLNNDTRVTEGWLGAMVKAARQSKVGVVGARLLYADGTIQHAGIEFINGIPDHPHRRAPGNLPAANKRRELDMVTGACLMTPRELFLSLGGFDEVFRNGVEDIDYCLRVRLLGRKCVYEPQATVYHLEGQSSGRFDHVNENLKIFFERWSHCFDKGFSFVAPPGSKSLVASRSLLAGNNGSTGNVKSGNAIVASWEGSFLDNGSLSHVNRELVAILRATAGLKIQCPPSAGPLPSPVNQNSGASLKADITVRHSWPPNWRHPGYGKLAVIQPWEFGSLPREWVDQAQHVDEFWVPSHHVRNVYIASGVPAQKVVVVPNGVDAERFHPQVAPMKLATGKKFKFLFVGGTIGRKGPDLLLQAYLKSFTSSDDVCLVIKDFGGASVYAGQTFDSQIRAAQSVTGAPEILYLDEELPPELVPGIYTACDCLVLPYRGEGFGLPVLEAMASGLPVIVTAGGATDDFVREDAGWRIAAARRMFGSEVSGLKLVGDGWLLEPNVDALGEAMRQAYANPTEARQRGRRGSVYARDWSWKKSASIVADRLRKLATNLALPPSILVPAPLPSVAAIGQLNEARDLLGRKKFEAAWNAALAAIAKRPFHPEGFLLLAEVAVAAGDADAARRCARHARALAPGWAPVKQFLNRPLRGGAKPKWLKFPDAIHSVETGNLRLSICLIVKNEERFLPQCLNSIRGLASQLVVVDTGSTDRTLEIAKEFGAEVYSHPWCDDFSAARNAALEHATGDWILTLDADEEFPASQHSVLLANLKNPEVMAFRLPLVNAGQEAEGRSFVPRLFRNAPGAFYFGRIHEQVFPSLLKLCKSWGLKTSMGAGEILHHGYNNDMVRERNKIERNLSLLRRACEEYPCDMNLAMNLGLELVRSGNLEEGLEKYREAFRLMSEMPPPEVAPELREVLLTQFTSHLYKIHRHEEVVGILNSPLAKSGGLTASLHFALGLSQYELKNYSDAAVQMRECLGKRNRPALSPINTDILTSMPNHCLAMALAKNGDSMEAEKAFDVALSESSGAPGIKFDYAKFLADTNRPVEGLHKLHELVAGDCRNSAYWRAGGEIALGRADFLKFALDWTGEAMRYVGGDLVVISQRAEALMLSGDTSTAGKLWERAWAEGHAPRALAALILCEAIGSEITHRPADGTGEASVSREFIAWYRKLIAMRGTEVVNCLNGQLDKLSRALPTAAKRIETALTETKGAEAIAS